MKIHIVNLHSNSQSETIIDQITFYQKMGPTTLNQHTSANWYKLWLKKHNYTSVNLYIPSNKIFKPLNGDYFKLTITNNGIVSEMEGILPPSKCVIM
jgi:hypothetical protein